MRGPYLSLTDAASRLGMSYGRVLRLVLVGDLEGGKADGHWCVSRDALERLLADLTEERRRALPLLAADGAAESAPSR
jgi:hypothetical protein